MACCRKEEPCCESNFGFDRSFLTEITEKYGQTAVDLIVEAVKFGLTRATIIEVVLKFGMLALECLIYVLKRRETQGIVSNISLDAKQLPDFFAATILANFKS